MQTLETILQQANKEINSASDLKSLEHFRIQYLGKKGEITDYLKTLGQLPPEERPAAGQKINTAKETILALIEKRSDELKKNLIENQLIAESIDITLPGRSQDIGTLHPVTQIMMDLRTIFTQMGFIFREGPEIENDYHNFTALNIPPLHPARAMQDTFYFSQDLLLRTHMSPVQIRTMKDATLPLRMVAMGRVYRKEYDLTHTPMFHQMECLVIDKSCSFADLKGILTTFIHAIFHPTIGIRFRPSYFPFTEPSAEVDIVCVKCNGQGCRICKQTGWLEILGCGMVHPSVLKGVKIDSEIYRGFAFGLGIDRLAMLKYGISDSRSLFENDLRFLNQF